MGWSALVKHLVENVVFALVDAQAVFSFDADLVADIGALVIGVLRQPLSGVLILLGLVSGSIHGQQILRVIGKFDPPVLIPIPSAGGPGLGEGDLVVDLDGLG